MKKQELDQSAINELFNNEDFVNMWVKMHTPKVRRYRKVGRNEICPFCDSGLKFKQCECSTKEEYEEYKSATR